MMLSITCKANSSHRKMIGTVACLALVSSCSKALANPIDRAEVGKFEESRVSSRRMMKTIPADLRLDSNESSEDHGNHHAEMRNHPYSTESQGAESSVSSESTSQIPFSEVPPTPLQKDEQIVPLMITEEEKVEAFKSKPSPWRFTVEPFGYAPLQVTGRTTLKGVRTNIKLSLWDVLDVLNGYIPFRASAEYKRFGLMSDTFFFNVSAAGGKTLALEGAPLSEDASVGLQQGLYDLAFRYRLGAPESALGERGQVTIIPYAGARLISTVLDIGADFTSLERQTFRSFNGNQTWVQPLIGAKASVFLSPRLQAFARADIGGFGLAGGQDISGNVQGGLRYAIGNNTDLSLSYRYFGVNWNDGASDARDRFGYHITFNGIESSIRFLF